MVHVAFWSPAWPLENFQNGIVTCVHWLKRELEAMGHQVSVFTFETAAKADSNVFPVSLPHGSLLSRIWRRTLRPLRPKDFGVFHCSIPIADAMLKLHRRNPIDIIEMEESFGWFADVARITSIPLLVKLHGPAFLSFVDGEEKTSLGRERIRREGLALSYANAIASPCKATLRQTCEKYQLNPVWSRIVPNPISATRQVPLWHLSGCDRDAVLFVGRFDHRKGADLLLKAFILVARARPSTKLIFVGPDVGLLTADGGRIHFSEFCESELPPDVSARVEYRGRMPNNEIAELRAKTMVTVVASRWENVSYAILEAMYQGCPLVCSDSGGSKEILEHGKTGLLAKSEDIQDLSSQILTLLVNADLARALGDAARIHVTAHYSGAEIARQSLESYAEVINQKASVVDLEGDLTA